MGPCKPRDERQRFPGVCDRSPGIAGAHPGAWRTTSSATKMRTFALIPAAGLSQRMGRPKLLLPLGGRPVLEHVVSALRAGGAAEVLVVVGPEGGALREPAERAGGRVLALDEQTPDMR